MGKSYNRNVDKYNKYDRERKQRDTKKNKKNNKKCLTDGSESYTMAGYGNECTY